jgi:hypothetical protein
LHPVVARVVSEKVPVSHCMQVEKPEGEYDPGPHTASAAIRYSKVVSFCLRGIIWVVITSVSPGIGPAVSKSYSHPTIAIITRLKTPMHFIEIKHTPCVKYS